MLIYSQTKWCNTNRRIIATVRDGDKKSSDSYQRSRTKPNHLNIETKIFYGSKKHSQKYPTTSVTKTIPNEAVLAVKSARIRASSTMTQPYCNVGSALQFSALQSFEHLIFCFFVNRIYSTWKCTITIQLSIPRWSNFCSNFSPDCNSFVLNLFTIKLLRSYRFPQSFRRRLQLSSRLHIRPRRTSFQEAKNVFFVHR